MLFGSSGLFFRDSGFHNTPYLIIRTHKETGKINAKLFVRHKACHCKVF
jgi:hypothetical protein